jgi:hypothetical protein
MTEPTTLNAFATVVLVVMMAIAGAIYVECVKRALKGELAHETPFREETDEC